MIFYSSFFQKRVSQFDSFGGARWRADLLPPPPPPPPPHLFSRDMVVRGEQ
uniref:Uncharacterized protein n=1 Tax=Haemonchus contortus TaxID=6289 RepID=A0A7I4YFK5_HAECO